MAEGTRLLSERGSQAHRGFESRPLRKRRKGERVEFFRSFESPGKLSVSLPGFFLVFSPSLLLRTEGLPQPMEKKASHLSTCGQPQIEFPLLRDDV